MYTLHIVLFPSPRGIFVHRLVTPKETKKVPPWSFVLQRKFMEYVVSVIYDFCDFAIG